MAETGNGNGRGGDWTAVRAWADAITRVGIPGAIALFLVYLGATEMPKLVRAVETVIIEQRLTRDLLREHMQEHNMQATAQTRLLQLACWNAANGDLAAQRKCYE